MTNKKIRLLFIVVGSILSLSACRTKPDTSWFTSNPCEAPCWFDIAPGKTMLNELVPLLQINPYVDRTSIANRGEATKIFSDNYFFEMLNHPIKGEIWLIDNRVSIISLFSIGDGEVPNELGFTVGEIIHEFGEPDFVVRVQDLGPGLLPISDAVHPIVILINSKKGIVFRYDEYHLSKKLRYQVTPDIMVGSLEFFSPDDFDRLLEIGALDMFQTATGEDPLKKFQPWKGYGEYPHIDS